MRIHRTCAIGLVMKKKPFVFGVDLDGVVADYIRGLKPIAADWLGVTTESLSDNVSYGFKEWKLGGPQGYRDLHRYAVKHRRLFEALPPIDGAPAALRRLSRQSIRIRIITHRLYIEWFHREAVTQTVEWLEQNGIPYWDLCFMKEKSSVDADAYVEDSPANITALRSAGRKVIVLRNSTNTRVSAPFANNWLQVESWVMRLARTR